jgi:hypothetical protein
LKGGDVTRPLTGLGSPKLDEAVLAGGGDSVAVVRETHACDESIVGLPRSLGLHDGALHEAQPADVKVKAALAAVNADGRLAVADARGFRASCERTDPLGFITIFRIEPGPVDAHEDELEPVKSPAAAIDDTAHRITVAGLQAKMSNNAAHGLAEIRAFANALGR